MKLVPRRAGLPLQALAEPAREFLEARCEGYDALGVLGRLHDRLHHGADAVPYELVEHVVPACVGVVRRRPATPVDVARVLVQREYRRGRQEGLEQHVVPSFLAEVTGEDQDVHSGALRRGHRVPPVVVHPAVQKPGDAIHAAPLGGQLPQQDPGVAAADPLQDRGVSKHDADSSCAITTNRSKPCAASRESPSLPRAPSQRVPADAAPKSTGIELVEQGRLARRGGRRFLGSEPVSPSPPLLHTSRMHAVPRASPPNRSYGDSMWLSRDLPRERQDQRHTVLVFPAPGRLLVGALPDDVVHALEDLEHLPRVPIGAIQP